MANISNTLFEFTTQIVDAAASSSPLSFAQVQPDVYIDIKPGKTIRVDDLKSAKLAIVPASDGWAVRKDNAVLDVQFVAMPSTQSLTDRLEARQISEDMADAWYLQAFENLSLQALFCAIGEPLQFNTWIKPGTVKMPVCVLRLLINPQKDG